MKKIAYLPMSKDYSAPGDRRRFCGFAKNKNIRFEKFDKNRFYDYIIISQNADLSYWATFKKNKTKLIFDFCDAYLFEEFSFKKSLRGLWKFITKQNIYLNLDYEKLLKKVCINSDVIICTTLAQQKKLLQYCKNVEIILDLQEDELLRLTKTKIVHEKDENKLNIFWEGQAGNITSFKCILEILNNFLVKDQINLYFVTDKKINYLSGMNIYKKTENVLKKMFNKKENIHLFEWSKENLHLVSKICDIGIIPVNNISQARYAHKPANKLHLMWRLGIAVLASPTPAMKLSNELSGINLLCYDKNDWIKYINFFLNNKKESKMIGQELKNVAKLKFSDQSELEKWSSLFKKT